MSFLTDFRYRLKRLFSQPRNQLGRWQRRFVFLIELLTHCGVKLIRDRAEEMAAALTYRTIFALIPLFVLGLIVFRAFGGLEDIQGKLYDPMYRFFGVPETSYVDDLQPGEQVVIEVPDESKAIADEAAKKERLAAGLPETPEEKAVVHQEQREVRASIRRALTEVTSKVANLSFASIGAVGVVLFLYAGIGLVLSMEYDFNIILQAPTSRPWHIRIPIHWAIITLGTGLLALSLYLSGRFVDWAGQLGVWSEVLPIMSRFLAFLASWVMLLLLYVLMPNTKVHLRSALYGSLVAAVLWELAKFGFQIYVKHALPYSALYGSLGLIPVFLFWVYISWMIVLFGLELTAAIQTTHATFDRPAEEPQAGLPGDPDLLLPLLTSIGQAFVEGKTVGRQALSDRLGLPTRLINELSAELEKAGLIHSVASDDGDTGYALAMPPNRIRMATVLDLGRKLLPEASQQESHPGWRYMTKIKDGQRQQVGDATLMHVIDGSSNNSRAPA